MGLDGQPHLALPLGTIVLCEMVLLPLLSDRGSALVTCMCKHASVPTHTHMHTHTHTHAHTHMHTHTYIHICMYMHMYIHTYTHTHIHTYTHTHIQMHIRSQSTHQHRVNVKASVDGREVHDILGTPLRVYGCRGEGFSDLLGQLQVVVACSLGRYRTTISTASPSSPTRQEDPTCYLATSTPPIHTHTHTHTHTHARTHAHTHKQKAGGPYLLHSHLHPPPTHTHTKGRRSLPAA